MYEMGRDIETRVLRSEKGCRIRVTHIHTRSDCVHTRDDTVRLNYASRFVRVIHSSHIVSIKLRTMTNSCQHSTLSNLMSKRLKQVALFFDAAHSMSSEVVDFRVWFLPGFLIQ